MKRLVFALISLLALANCAPSETATYHASWDGVAYVNPMVKPQWGTMKSLEQPGIY